MNAPTHTNPDCIFCRIVAGEIPSKRIHEDEHAIAFLDVAPFKRGHALVVPRAHVENILEDAEVLAGLAPAITQVGAHLMRQLGASGLNVVSNVGADAGQSVFHLHVHLIPRYADDPGYAGMVEKSEGIDPDEVFAALTDTDTSTGPTAD